MDRERTILGFLSRENHDLLAFSRMHVQHKVLVNDICTS